MRALKNTLLTLFILFSQLAYSQQIAVFFIEDFENTPSTTPPYQFDINSPAGFGNNQWRINSLYDGLGFYPNTPPQDSTVGGIGQIGTPGGNYMHIKNNNIPVNNANYDPLSTSEAWAEINTGYCTYGFTKISLTFWWLAKGSPADFGEVYYSTDGGTTWILTTNTGGFTKYSNMDLWKFTEVEIPAFVNQPDLRFAFKWTNDGINSNDVLPFSIDDVILVGEYDLTGSLNAVNFTPNPLCHEYTGDITALVDIVNPLCEGTYTIEFSDSAGDFTNSTVIAQFSLDDTWNGFSGLLNVSGQIPIPTSLPIGNCYKFRINRTTPPLITGTPSTICIQIIDCPDSIITEQPAVTMDPLYDSTNTANPPGLPAGQQPLCISSLIDVPFFSYGAYNPGNNYVLELSDSTGSFDNATTIGGPVPDTRTWDPDLPGMPPPPGSISGQIPAVAPGCNYFIRVVSTDPVVDSLPFAVPFGPFCIILCAGDGPPGPPGGGGGGGGIPQGGNTSFSVCVTNTDSACFIITPIDINTFDTTLYNEFLVQLLSKGPPGPPEMTLVSIGQLDITIDYVAGEVYICIPPLPNYLALGLELKGFYINIVGVSGPDTTALWGIASLTIGGVSGSVLSINIIPDDSVYCGSNTTIFLVATGSFAPSSEFIWSINGFANPPLGASVSINASGFASGTYIVTVQEVSPTGGDCVGPVSATDTFYIQILPDVDIFGPTPVCVGDTTTYSGTFNPATYYIWGLGDISGIGTVIDSANNQITIVWNAVGSASISLAAVNECAIDIGDIVTNSITVNVLPLSNGQITTNTSNICEGETVQLTATNLSWPIENNFVWTSNGDTIQENFSQLGNTDILTVSPESTTTYIVMMDNGCSPDFDTIVVKVIPFPTSTSICIDDTVLLNAASDVVNQYQWFKLPDTTLIISTDSAISVSPLINTDYLVNYDSICSHVFSVTVNDPDVTVGDDKEIFRGDEVLLNASGGISYSWTPTVGLSCADCFNPTASPDTTTTYVVTITDIDGCIDQDTIIIKVVLLEVPDAFTPDGDGINDVLYVYNFIGKRVDVKGDALASLDFKIFNRWGEVIFETTDINIGWDGKHMKSGRFMELGVYVWLLTAKTTDGEDIGPISGNVSLIR